MYKTLSITAILLSTVACSTEQKPAPYVQKGDNRFSRSSSSNSYSNTSATSYGGTGSAKPIYSDNDYIDAPINSDNFGSSEIQSRSLMPQTTNPAPLNRNDGVIDFSSKAQSSDYIDSEAKAVPLAPLQSASSNSYPRPVLDEPTNNGGKGYLDLGAVNSFDSPSNGIVSEPKKTSKLLSAKPLAKPVYKEATEIAAPAEATAEAVVATETTESVAIPAAPLENVAAPAPAIQKVEHTTKISDNKSVTTTKTIERVDSATNGEAAIEKAPIIDEKKIEPASTKKQFIRPIQGKIIGKFGNEADGTFNDGVKIQAAKGTDVKAADGGEVVYSGNQLQGYGNMIIVRHANGYLTSYAHLEGLDIKKGAKVGQGDVIGHVGDTGNVSEPMLHFGVREGREPVDPQKFLK